ncbi:MAG: hypothetical protein LBH59_09640 [Planctomycetaceae bacterium]|nr:hypothetical protein [Planctomycetaceae bacterium]
MFFIPKPVWAVGFALEQTLHVVALAVFSFLILKRLQHILFVLEFFYARATFNRSAKFIVRTVKF